MRTRVEAVNVPDRTEPVGHRQMLPPPSRKFPPRLEHRRFGVEHRGRRNPGSKRGRRVATSELILRRDGRPLVSRGVLRWLPFAFCLSIRRAESAVGRAARRGRTRARTSTSARPRTTSRWKRIEAFEKLVGKHQAIVASSSFWGRGGFPGRQRAPHLRPRRGAADCTGRRGVRRTNRASTSRATRGVCNTSSRAIATRTSTPGRRRRAICPAAARVVRLRAELRLVPLERPRQRR